MAGGLIAQPPVDTRPAQAHNRGGRDDPRSSGKETLVRKWTWPYHLGLQRERS